MKIFFSGWFGGFFEKTNPGLNTDFFINLFEKVYNEKCQIGGFEESEILCEFCMLINTKTKLNSKKWKNTYMYSGESYTNQYQSEYDCVLWMERNNKNVINIPLHIAYLYTNNFVSKLETKRIREKVPENDVLVVISNPNGKTRNKFLSKLEKKMHITYAGRYKNNIGGLLHWDYNKPEFHNFVSQFKFIISMENTKYETGITEKITHGMLAQTIPVYWGSDRVSEYFNNERFLTLRNDDENTIDELINKMIKIKQDKSHWLDIVNKNVFPGDGKMWRTIDEIATDIRCLLKKTPYGIITKVNIISNEKFEPERYKSMNKLMKRIKVDNDFVKYIAPTYKHTIKEDTYNYHCSPQLVLRMRPNGPILKKAELSIILNFKKNFEYIIKNYKEGIFLMFESDVMISKDIDKLQLFLNDIKDKEWDSIHIGMFQENIYDYPVTKWITGYRNYNEELPLDLIQFLNKNCKNKKYIEDITDEKSEFRLIRKYHPRCMDSFIWKYDGIVKYLNFLNKMEENFSCPADYLFIHFLENNIDFKHYWSINEFFKQGSNLGLVKSKIQ